MQFPNELIQLETLENARKLFGLKLKAKRKAAGLTQEQLGRLANRAGNTIAMIERGEQAPEWDAMEAIFERLGEPPAYYFSEERRPQPKTIPTKKEALSAAKEAIEIASLLGPDVVETLAALKEPQLSRVLEKIAGDVFAARTEMHMNTPSPPDKKD